MYASITDQKNYHDLRHVICMRKIVGQLSVAIVLSLH